MKKILALVLAMLLVLSMVGVLAETVHGTNTTTNAGSITISNTTIGKKYSLYKIFDATVALNSDGTAKLGTDGKPIINYTVPAGKTLPADNAWFAVDAYGNVTAKANADITTDAFKTWAAGFATEVVKDHIATESTLTFDQLEFGYYYIESEVGGVLTIDSTTPSATVVDKNQTDSFDKYILGDANAHIKLNEAGLAETVPFEVTVEGVNYIGVDKVYKYVIKDAIEHGFTLEAAPTVTVAGATPVEAVTITYKKADDTATTNVAEAVSFEIVVPWAAGGVYAGNHLYGSTAQIKVNYSAHLDPAKFNGVIVGGFVGNKNAVNVDHYKAHETPTTETPEGVGPEVDTYTLTTSLTIKKEDGNTHNPLKGAEFTLTGPNGPVTVVITETFTQDDSEGEYWLLKDGTYTKQDPNGTINGNAVDKTVYASETNKYKVTTNTVIKNAEGAATGSVAEVNEDGIVTFSGLAAGEYTLTETKVPAGYNAIAPITFTISFDDREKIDENGTMVDNPNYKKFSANNGVVLDDATNTLKLTVDNFRGTELPSTGGIGTTIFYVAGSILVLAAAILLITKRRMGAND